MRELAINLAAAICILCSCSQVSRSNLTKTFRATEQEFQDHTGFILCDVKTQEELFSYRADNYFTPASNTKIFTLYAGLKILGDSVPALKYHETVDSLIVWGTGDPSFLYEKVNGSDRVYNFLKESTRQIYFSNDNFFTNHFGPGWAWDDYNYTFSSERSALPIYGNTIKVSHTQSGYLKLIPQLFRKNLWLADSIRKISSFVREPGGNRIDYFPGKSITDTEKSIPFHCDPWLVAEMLSDTLERSVSWIHKSLQRNATVIHSLPVDSIYRVMMQESDNFIAEQILLMCAGVISDSLKPEIAINFMKKNYLTDLPDNPVWVDGSGLSRYNLFTPRSIVSVWRKLYGTIPQERLFSLLAVGGRKGTIRNYSRREKPYIYGKTGTLSNNHSLSGFLVARSGRLLVFSFMNNNYIVPVSDVRRRMEEILHKIYENY